MPSLQRNLAWEIRIAVAMLLVMLLYATIGGFGSLFSLIVTPQIRALNRISPFIAFASLLVGVGTLKYFFQKFNYKISANVIAIIAIPLLTYDQVVYRHNELAASYASDAVSFDADKQFSKALKEKLPPGARILQLPFIEFPETGSSIEYLQLRNLLHAPELHWTYGAMKGRPESNWLHLITSLNPHLFVEALNETGFSAVVVDNRAPAPNMNVLIKELIQSSTIQKIDSNNGVQTGYVLAAHTEARSRAIAPDRNWYGVESNTSHTWVWAAGNASLELAPSDKKTTCSADLSFMTIHSRKIDAVVDGVTVGSLSLPDGGTGELHLTLGSSVSGIELRTDSPSSLPDSGDPRVMSFGWQVEKPPTCVFTQ
jgi:phosphoglycerol transferase